MKILFDESWSGGGGIGRFANEISVRVAFDERFVASSKPASPSVSIKLIRYVRKGCVTFLPGYIPPFFARGNYVFTIHDLNHLDRPENTSVFKKLFYRFVIKRGCKKASKIVTVSEFSRGRIIEWSGVAPNKVVNVGNGVDKRFNPSVVPYSLGVPYFLCVGNRKAHKNEARVIEAFSRANVDERVALVFTGMPEESLEKLVEDNGLHGRVKFLGVVSEETLPSLYKGAKGLLFPSLYEGFGLPVLEAMACGTPVVTSNVTSLPEVAGDAAILVDPLDIGELKRAIECLEHDSKLRCELVFKGYDRVSYFTWEKTARKVKDVLDGIGSV
ncbi:glycosyltransferase family 4 protein [Halomonas caseinilytica]|uniref:glycosyltransferase family 4 protein n=1 Tax=Halomonas caseinilytica TaxID=438744 RepID=UPI000A8C1952|nr:glycosyltransferase family 1 protein [Halomonas caseinilytica]